MEHAIGASVVIAGFLRGIVPILKSPMLGQIWHKWPKWLKPLILCGVAMLLGLCDALALGVPFSQATLSALSAVGIAVSSYETGKGIKMPEKPAELGK